MVLTCAMTVSEFRNVIQNAESISIWIVTPRGIRHLICQETYEITVGFDRDRRDDGGYVFASRDSTTGDVKLQVTKDVAKSTALNVSDSYLEGIVLEGDVY